MGDQVLEKYEDYIDVSKVKIGDVVKFLEKYYKIIAVEGSNNELVLLCEPNKKVKTYTDLNHQFITIDNSVYEFDSFAYGNGKAKMKYKLFSKASPQPI